MRFAEVNDPHHAFTMLCKAMKVKKEFVGLYREAVCFAK